MLKRRKFCTYLAYTSALAPSLAYSADSFPNKTMHWVIPAGPGTGFETVVRHIAEYIHGEYGINVLIENRPGANTQLGINYVAKSKPDGYTVALGFITNLTLAPHVYKTLPYSPSADLLPVALLGQNYLAFVTNNRVPANNIREFLDWAKTKSAGVNVGTTSVGGLPHLAVENLARTADIPFTIITYNSNPEILQDLIGGRLDAAMPDFSGAWPMIDSKQIKILGTTYARRDPNHKDIPVIGETIDGYSAVGWFGFVAPAGTPTDRIEKLNFLINAAITNSEEVQKSMKTFAIIPKEGTAADFGKILKDEDKKYQDIIHKIGFDPLDN